MWLSVKKKKKHFRKNLGESHDPMSRINKYVRHKGSDF